MGLLATPSNTIAQTGLERDATIPRWLRERLADRIYHRRDNSEMVRLIRPIGIKAQQSVVGIESGNRMVSLGTVVSDPLRSPQQDRNPSRVYIITKRSELSNDPIRVRLPSGPMVAARLAAVRRRNDLALLTVDASDVDLQSLKPVTFDVSVPPVGSFLITPSRSGKVIGFGVVGTGPITVEHKGKLGVILQRISQTGARIERIYPDSGADAAGLELGDRIVAIDGRRQTDFRDVIATLGTMFPGEVVRLTIDRNGDTLDLTARLREEAVMNESENDARVNGPRNERLSGFDSV
ncbi:MAG: PDZ domain-containing protein, partial [Planctomycetota bacterium]